MKEIDQEERERLLAELEIATQRFLLWQEKREKELFKPVKQPITLKTLLPNFLKLDLAEIGHFHRIQGISKYNKQQLVEAILEASTHCLLGSVECLDQERYKLIKKIYQAQGILPVNDMDILDIESYMVEHFVFPGKMADRNVLVLPEEMMHLLGEMNDLELERWAKRNTQWIQLTKGLLYYYGALDIFAILDKVSELSNYSGDPTLLIRVLFTASEFNECFVFTDFGYCDDRCDDGARIMMEHELNKALNFYPFTKEQILKAGSDKFYEVTSETMHLYKFIEDNYMLDKEEIDDIILQCITQIQLDCMPTQIIEYLQSRLEMPDQLFVQDLLGRIVQLYDTTRLWKLKGHTVNEVAKIEGKELPTPVVPEPIKVKEIKKPKKNKSSNGVTVVDFQARKKMEDE